jgi:hypothetical protein
VVRTLILCATLLFIGFLALLTAATVVFAGITVLTLVSLLVLALFAFGIVRALRNSSRK